MKKIALGIAAMAVYACTVGVPLNLSLDADYTKLLNPQEVTIDKGFFSNTYNIRLPGELGNIDTINNILIILDSASKHDIVVFHIKGYGGDVDTLLTLINNIKLSKAAIIMSVEGPTYSAYSVLATQGDELKMSKYSFLHFHTSSLVNLDCSQVKGSDRHVPNVVHCMADYKANMNVWNQLLDNIEVLTTKQKTLIKLGFDVFLTPKMIKEQS